MEYIAMTKQKPQCFKTQCRVGFDGIVGMGRQFVTADISPVSGIVIGRLNLPLVHTGDALFHIAGFDDSVAVSESLDDFKEEIGETLPPATGG